MRHVPARRFVRAALSSLLAVAPALLVSGAGLSGCAEPVKDVNRVQGNYLKKSDLEGEWYMLTTVVDVPPTRAVSFAGETGKLERVRFEFHENELVAYRSYPQIPGADTPATDVAFDGKDQPLAIWPVESQFDIKREYNASTGEQDNVLEENTSDRLWFQREYARVDWSASEIHNFDFILNFSWEDDFDWTGAVNVAHTSYVSAEEGGPDAFYRETNTDGVTKYFDVLAKWDVEPDLYYCWWLPASDCAGAEVTSRTSFSRVPENPQYEPFHYDDQLMSRFGYFRSERYTYDEQLGIRDAGRQYLINRHDIWAASYDADGKTIPLPKRETKTVPYYLSPTFPSDPLLDQAAVATMAQWNDAAKKAVASVRGVSPAEVKGPPIFTLCHNPVNDKDDKACGDIGFAPRMGDLRYSVLHWVDTDTMEGLLGYGPSAADPLTGETISGKAYIYGAAIGTYARYATDVIRLANEDLDEQALVHGSYFNKEVAARAKGQPSVARHDPRLDAVPLSKRLMGQRAHGHQKLDPARLKQYDPGAVRQRLEAAQAAGMAPDVGGSVKKQRPGLAPSRPLMAEQSKALRKYKNRLRAHSVDLVDMVEPNIAGLVEKYKGRTDYDAIWHELRAEIFASTAEHEVGHTMGLRHNFQGSYDSLNYPDQYWEERAENLPDPTTGIKSYGDLYETETLTQAQSESGMRQHQYSSIMDYGFNWANDINGLGKYDFAAFTFGYTSGSYEANGDRCSMYPSEPKTAGKCLAELPGYIEVFTKTRSQLPDIKAADGTTLPGAAKILTTSERGSVYEDSGLPSISALERYHYTTVANSFPALADFSEAGRKPMLYADYLDTRTADRSNDADRPIRVPYMFCSDEWESGVMSCRMFDQGADPFELAKSTVDQYRSYYWFVNFRRDRTSFSESDAYDVYLNNTFLPLSDLFQFWLWAPSGYDAAFDTSYEVATNFGFNVFAEALSTPPYGSYCEGRNGHLIHLSDEPVVRDERTSENLSCKPGGQRYNLAPGIGRRAISRFDEQAGYYLEDKPLESGHVWTASAALAGLTDPESYIVGQEGDAGTYLLGYYDGFPDEMEKLLDSILARDYASFAPRARLAAGQSVDGGPLDIVLDYPPMAALHDYQANLSFNPETGTVVGQPSPDENPDAPPGGAAGLCDDCTQDSDCSGYTGALGGTYCVAFADRHACMVDCTEQGATCPSGTTCIGGNCLPQGRHTCDELQGVCDATHPSGRCDAGQTCVEGACAASHWSPVVETDATFWIDQDILFEGFFNTTVTYTTRFSDQLNVFRPGTADEVDADPAVSERYEFTDPFSGVRYAAVQERCDLRRPADRGTPVCGQCVVDAQCAGYTGRPDGTMCAFLDGKNKPGTCLQRCTQGADQCSDGYSCNANQVCEPLLACAPPTPDCATFGAEDTGAVKMVKRGQNLMAAYDAAFKAYFADDGSDPAREQRLRDEWSSLYWDLRGHVDLIELLRSNFHWFGGIF